jgi:hypothetical protein
LIEAKAQASAAPRVSHPVPQPAPVLDSNVTVQAAAESNADAAGESLKA